MKHQVWNKWKWHCYSTRIDQISKSNYQVAGANVNITLLKLKVVKVVRIIYCWGSNGSFVYSRSSIENIRPFIRPFSTEALRTAGINMYNIQINKCILHNFYIHSNIFVFCCDRSFWEVAVEWVEHDCDWGQCWIDGVQSLIFKAGCREEEAREGEGRGMKVRPRTILYVIFFFRTWTCGCLPNEQAIAQTKVRMHEQ